MKWRIASISLLLVTLLAVAAGWFSRPSAVPQTLFSETFSGENLQLGYYDLLSRQREIYDTRFDRHGENVLLTLTSPNDNRFMAKVSMEQPEADSEGISYHYRQIHYADSGDARMVKNVLGNAEQNGVRFDILTFGGEQLAIAPSGQILITDWPARAAVSAP